MKHFRLLRPGANYRVIADPSTVPLARRAPKFAHGELVCFIDLVPAVHEGFIYLTFAMLERGPGEYLRIQVSDFDSTPEPDWSEYFERV